MNSPSSPPAAGTKRPYQPDASSNGPEDSHTGATTPAVISAFRNVSACNRCRVRKNRCDQRLPACAACEKVNHRCVGFDPITKKEIPRSYVYFLESRLAHLEALLVDNGIPFERPDAYDNGAREGHDRGHVLGNYGHDVRVVSPGSDPATASITQSPPRQAPPPGQGRSQSDEEKISKIVSDIGMVSVQGASDRRHLGSATGISFSRIVRSAIKKSHPDGHGTTGRTVNHGQAEPSRSNAGGAGSMRDSYFGLSTKPTYQEAPFPDRDLAEKLVHLYFEHANPQIPILHRVEFTRLMHRAFAVKHDERSSRDLFVLNMVFAIGAGVIFGSSDTADPAADQSENLHKKVRLASQQAQPEEYHAAAIVHLNLFLGMVSSSDGGDGGNSDLEDLQAVLLLAGFALLRPVAPGLWYIVGTAMRLAVDLGLHHDEAPGLTNRRSQTVPSPDRNPVKPTSSPDGQHEWGRDMARRLWWCTYAFDRLVSTCVGRPFGITDMVVTTEFPSVLEDKYITRAGIQTIAMALNEPSYKRVAQHYLRLRLLQSEILHVLQYQQVQQARTLGINRQNPFMHKNLPSPFLARYRDFRRWRIDVDQRLYEWKESSPSQQDTGVQFSHQFLELNYWQAVIMLYRNSLSIPAPFADDVSPTTEVSTPVSLTAEVREDEEMVFLKCAEAGQQTLKLYRQLHRQRLVNYTYLATHHIFMAGIAFLYAVWHSPDVRSRLTLDDFDFTILSATSVLGDLMVKCPPARACRDALERMSKSTVQMCLSPVNVGLAKAFAPIMVAPIVHEDRDSRAHRPQGQASSMPRYDSAQRPPPQFDMHLRDLFPQDLDASARPSRSLPRSAVIAQHVQQAQQRFGRRRSSRAQEPINPSLSQNRTIAASPNSQFQSAGVTSSPFGPPHSPEVPAPQFGLEENSYNPDFMSHLGINILSNLESRRDVESAMYDSPTTQQEMHQPYGSSPGLSMNMDSLSDAGLGSDVMDDGMGSELGTGMVFDINQFDLSGSNTGFDLDGYFFGGY